MSLSVYVIFHDTLHEEYYEELDEDEFNLITFVAVNENVEKVYNKERFKNVICEWQLPIYFPVYQKLFICDSTRIPKSHITDLGVHLHLFKNNVCSTDYIWTFHNDMYFHKGSIKQVFNLLDPTRGVTIRAENYSSLVSTSTFGFHEKDLYDSICREYNVNKNMLFPFHTNMCMDTKLYYKNVETLVDCVHKYFENIVYGPSYRLCICIERLFGLLMVNGLTDVQEVLGILHVKKSQYIECKEKTKNGTLRQYDIINVEIPV